MLWIPPVDIKVKTCEDEEIKIKADVKEIHFPLGRTVRSWMEVIPEALPKFSRLTRRRKLIFGLAPGKLRFTAFQRCISWGGVRLVEMGQNSDCLKKSA